MKSFLDLWRGQLHSHEWKHCILNRLGEFRRENWWNSISYHIILSTHSQTYRKSVFIRKTDNSQSFPDGNCSGLLSIIEWIWMQNIRFAYISKRRRRFIPFQNIPTILPGTMRGDPLLTNLEALTQLPGGRQFFSDIVDYAKQKLSVIKKIE